MYLYICNNDAYPFMETAFTPCDTLQEAKALFERDIMDTLKVSDMGEARALLGEEDTLEEDYASVKNGKGEVVTFLIKQF